MARNLSYFSNTCAKYALAQPREITFLGKMSCEDAVRRCRAMMPMASLSACYFLMLLCAWLCSNLRIIRCSCDPCLASVSPCVHFVIGLPAIVSVATIHGQVLANHAVPTSPSAFATKIQTCDLSPICAESRLIEIAADSKSQQWNRCSCCFSRLADTDLNDEGPPKHQAKAEGETWRACTTAEEQPAPNKTG